LKQDDDARNLYTPLFHIIVVRIG